MRYSGSVVGVSLSAMVPCLAVLKSIRMSPCLIQDVMQTRLTLLCGPVTALLQRSATSPSLFLTRMGNYMPVGSRVKIGSGNISFSVLYGTTWRACQGGDEEGWFREDGLSAPRKDRVCIEEVGCTRVLLQPSTYRRPTLIRISA
jgi:hypothetical protein